jgi:hypothetical protein
MELIPIDQVNAMALAVAKSGFFGLKTPEQAAALMLVAQADGLHPAKAATHYHIIGGKPALSADAMLARFQAAGGRVDWGTYGDEAVEGTFTHSAGGSVKIRWDLARAKKAGVGNLDKFPAAMMRARCISEGVRTVFPGVIVGMYTPEELVSVHQAAAADVVDLGPLLERIQGAETLSDLVEAFKGATTAHPAGEEQFREAAKARRIELEGGSK